MKNTKNRKIYLILLIVSFVFALCGVVGISIYIFSSIKYPNKSYGPFHNEAIVKNVDEYTNMTDSVIFLKDGMVYYKLYGSSETSIHQFSIDNPNVYAKKIKKYNNDTIVILTSDSSIYLINSSETIKYSFNGNYSKLNREPIDDLLIVNETILCFDILINDTIDLYELDLTDKSLSFIRGALTPGKEFSYKEQKIYIDYDFKPYFIESGDTYKQLIISNNELSIYDDLDSHSYKINSSNFHLNYKDSSFEYRNSFFTVFSNDDNYYFSTYNQLDDEKCLATNCISRFGSGEFWKYNDLTKELTKIITLPECSFVIAINDGSIYYYYNGGIYKDNVKIQEIKPIIPEGEYYTSNNASVDDDKIIQNVSFLFINNTITVI